MLPYAAKGLAMTSSIGVPANCESFPEAPSAGGAPRAGSQPADGTQAGRNPRRRHSGGFTLVELLVVLAILSLIMVIAVPQAIKFLGGALHDAAAIQVERLSGILDLYRLDVGKYPDDGEGLQALGAGVAQKLYGEVLE